MNGKYLEGLGHYVYKDMDILLRDTRENHGEIQPKEMIAQP
jgi:hypothetical protein